ncbi:MAG: HAMP domain-containing sensor histidine kinase [Bacteroidia bacterium]
MRLQLKFAIYNALSKALIIGGCGLVLPALVQSVVYNHIDSRLHANADRAMMMIKQGGLDDIKREQDCSYGDHTIFKEEFIQILPVTDPKLYTETDSIMIESWNVDGEDLKHRVIRRNFIYDNQMYSLNIGEGLSTIQKLDETFYKFTIWLMILVILVSIASDFAFIGVLLQPFHKIVDKLKGVEDPLKFQSHPVKSSTYEFKYLDSTFEELMHKIKNDFNKEKEFIANVSHELQTPISILQNRFENIIAEGKTDDETSLKIVESQKTLGRLSRVIKALLMISKIENEQYLKNEEASLNEIVEEVCEEVEDRCEQKCLTIKQHFEGPIHLSNCNKSLLHNMILNIIINAIKYNKPNGLITISGKTTGDQFELCIADTGKGIPTDQVDLIFERFKRFHANDGNSFGLGLPIVKTIAIFHGFTIQVKSEVDKGTEFILTGRMG